jgi:plasmid stabilization system protein ParE
VTLNGLRLSRSAEDELLRIFEDSAIRFRRDASIRYEDLVSQAIFDLVEDPDRIGAQKVDARIHYHLRHSRNRVAGERVRDQPIALNSYDQIVVRDPHHYLVVRIECDRLAVLAVVHDAMVEGATRRIEEGEAG